MASNALVTNSSMEEGYIDRNRIVDGDLVPDEYFCPICQYLLWRPRSCSSCQHLFCEKCIQTWIQNPNSGKRCPFRCESFEDRRCPPYVQSFLSHLNIHCRNSQFSCSEVVCYDQLEHHENVECEYVSKRCSECDKLFFLSKLVEEEKEMSRLSIILKDVDAIGRSKEKNLNYLNYILLILKLILLNCSEISIFVVTLLFAGFVSIVFWIISKYIIFCIWSNKYTSCGSFLIMLLSFLLTYVISIVFQFIFSRSIICCFLIFIFVLSRRINMSLESL